MAAAGGGAQGYREMIVNLPPKKISLKDAVKSWEERFGHGGENKIEAQTELKFNMWMPPIEKLDGSTAQFVKCEFLSLSTNMIERLSNLNSMKNLKIISLGRNMLKSLAGIEACSETIEEIWASYNQIEKFAKNVQPCKKLRALYLANNWVREWGEVVRLNELPKLEELVIVGCPLQERFIASGNTEDKWNREIGRKIQHLKKIDGANVKKDEAEEDEV